MSIPSSEHQVSNEYTVHDAALDSIRRGSIMMVKSWKAPFYAVPYPEYVVEMYEGELPETAVLALDAIRSHRSNTNADNTLIDPDR